MKTLIKTPISSFLIALACSIGLVPMAQAVLPAPDGGYPGGNTAEGQNALFSLSTGGYNTAVGFLSLRSNTAGSFNTGIGAATLFANTGDQNTAVGVGALFSNSTGASNTANGAFALFSNTSGPFNTATGINALRSNTIGNGNTATGLNALVTNTIGNSNSALGAEALELNTGSTNTAVGVQALQNNNTGTGNIALGYQAGINVSTANNVICIGASGNNVDNACYIGQIFGATSLNGTAVFINSNGRLGTTTSSRHFKEGIKPMEKASEALFALKPVVFRYKKEIDPAGTSQLGLVAEDVERVSPDLVVRDKEGRPYSVRYDQVNAMLLNEFLKEHRAFLAEQRKVHELEANTARQQKEIEALTAGLQRVSAQLELSKPAPHAVLNNQ